MRKLVLANGCWDPLHYGHLLHLRAARGMGTILVVSVTDDESVMQEKGAGRPLFTAEHRAELLGALRCVDKTVIVPGHLEAIELVRPQVFVKGPDYAGKISEETRDFCRQRGVEIRFTNGQKWSATDICGELRRGSGL